MSFFNPFRSTPSKAAQPKGGASGAADDGFEARKSGAGTPLELINYDTSSGKFRLGQEALHVLRNVNGPVGVVAVCGRARQGKSFILNQLLGQSTGFVVAPTHRPCTKGLWMWSSPVERRTADGSKYHLVLLDTEGIDAYDQTGQYSTQIFSLAVLLSSLFVYNQMGGIDEAALDRLSLVTEMTKHVRVRAGSAAGEGEAELREFNPSFLWLLRDFYLDLEEDGRKLTPREYLDIVLRPLRGSGASVEAKNKIRESIKNLFPNRDCFALIRPMNDEQQLTKLDTISPDKLRPQFVEDIKRLTRLIFMRAQPKRLGSQIISGSMLAALAEAYVDAINHGAVPTIATAWQGVAEAECRRAADAAEAGYNSAFNKAVAIDEAGMDAEHARCMAIANQIYTDGSIGDESIRSANRKRFLERLESQFRQFRQERLASTEAECRKLISDITTKLTQMANKEETTLAALQQELTKWEQQYRTAPRTEGPAKWQLHAEFMQGTYAGIAAGIAQRQERAAAAERLAASERLRQREQSLEEIRAKVVELETQLKATKQELAQERGSKQQSAGYVASLEEKLRALTSAQEKKSAELEAKQRSEVDRLRQELQQANSLASDANTAAEARLRQVSAELNAAKESAEARVAQLEAELAARPVSNHHEGGPADMEEDGYGTPDEDRTANLTPSGMTINAIKDWLVENGHENVVWELANSRAKKPRYVEEMNKVLGR